MLKPIVLALALLSSMAAAQAAPWPVKPNGPICGATFLLTPAEAAKGRKATIISDGNETGLIVSGPQPKTVTSTMLLVDGHPFVVRRLPSAHDDKIAFFEMPSEVAAAIDQGRSLELRSLFGEPLTADVSQTAPGGLAVLKACGGQAGQLVREQMAQVEAQKQQRRAQAAQRLMALGAALSAAGRSMPPPPNDTDPDLPHTYTIDGKTRTCTTTGTITTCN